MPLPLLATLALAGGAAALANRKKKGSSGGGASAEQFNFQPYSGYRPPEVSFLRPVEEDYTNITRDRAKGIDVGYDPARRTAQEELLRSQIDKRLEDDVRSAQGTASAAGLSSNLRAQEALAGRARRDASRTYGEGLANITIEDLARANQERDVNTARLGGLNSFNFGQQNQVADFDLRKYATEQGFRQSAAGSAADALGRRNEMTSDLLNTGIGAASLFLPDKGVLSGPALQSLASQGTGYGAAPSPSPIGALSNFRNDPTYRRRIQGR